MFKSPEDHRRLDAPSVLGEDRGRRTSLAQELRQRLTEFANNNIQIDGQWYSPLNQASLTERYQESLHKNELLSARIAQLQTALKAAGGVTKDIYDDSELGYILRSLVRDALSARWWGSSSVNFIRCEHEDEEGALATQSIREQFPDGRYQDKNIYSAQRVSNSNSAAYKEEGTLFYLEFSLYNTAQSITIFHQGHRDKLQVASISWENLRLFINNEATQAAIPPTPPPTFTLAGGTYLNNITNFNEQFKEQGIAVYLVDNQSGSPDLAVTLLSKTARELAVELLSLNLVQNVTDGVFYPSVECLVTNPSAQYSEAWLDLFPVTSDSSNRLNASEYNLEDGPHTAILFGRNSADVIELVVNYMRNRKDRKID